ncbi:PIG-L deacetylase family protein [Nonomuraea fuscirosea]|uniref:PIG-L deacetylase family protein n=1 Tax=Nonomuraea fuscirosea TaxID=1291556 RepID=UPI00342741EE
MTLQLEPMPDDWQRALAIVAHPDDLEYGCASAVATWTDAGREVVYLMATRGEAGIDTLDPATAGPVREREELASAALVGVTSVEFLDHADGVIEYGTALRRDLAAAIRRHRPELLITLNFDDTWGGTHWNTPDHRAVGRAVMDAAGDAGNRWIFPDTVAAPWDGVRWVAVAGVNNPTHAVDVTDGLERGVRSLMEHRAYIQALTDKDPEQYARDQIEGFARQEAERFGGRPAVTFRLYPR